MLIVVKILAAIYLWLLFPVLLGSVWAEPGRKAKNRFVFRYLIGLVSQWAIFFLLARWAIDRQMSLHALGKTWGIWQIVLTVLLVVWGIRKRRFCIRRRRIKRKEMLVSVLAIVFLVIAGTVCGGANQKEYTVEAALTMYVTDTLYVYDATTGKNAEEMLPVQAEELADAAKDPIEAYYAANSLMCRINPSKFIRILLPAFLMPFYFGIYHLWAWELFGKNRTKRILFQAVIWMLYGSALISERAVMVQVFANCWNGETLFFAGLLPFAVWLLLKKSSLIRWGLLYLVCALAGQFLYGEGGFIITFIWAAAVAVTQIKRWKNGSSI